MVFMSRYRAWKDAWFNSKPTLMKSSPLYVSTCPRHSEIRSTSIRLSSLELGSSVLQRREVLALILSRQLLLEDPQLGRGCSCTIEITLRLEPSFVTAHSN